MEDLQKLDDFTQEQTTTQMEVEQPKQVEFIDDKDTEKLQAYFEQHKEQLKVAGIEQCTYFKNMQRAVKWHKICANLRWYTVGWLTTLGKTFFNKTKPMDFFLNSLGFVLNISLVGAVILGVVHLIKML